MDFSRVYSFSKLERFEKCPLDYYFYYLDPKWKGFKKPRDYKTKGQAVHGAITLFYHLPVEKRNFENLKKCLYDAWFSEIDPSKNPPLGELGGFKNITHERKTYFEALKLLKNFFNLKEGNPQFFYLPTKNIRYSFNDYEELIRPIEKDFFISGKFDRIDKLEGGNLRVVDFKTSKKFEDKFQLDFYKVLAELNFGVKVKLTSFYYLNDGTIADFDVSDQEMEDLKKKILKKIETIEKTKEFLPKPSKMCSHCDFQEICPTKK